MPGDEAPAAGRMPFFRRPRWRGFGLDSALIAVVALFALMLGLLPLKKPEAPAAGKTPALQAPSQPVVKRALKPPPARAATAPENAATAAGSKPAPPARDKYEPLRQAWGD
jgi:hypothetical protein